MKNIAVSLLLSIVLIGSSFSQESYFLSWPAPSPDGRTIVFSFEGDLWQASIENGEALRLTAMQGYETHARYSPDGKWIAFTSTQYGNPDVFVIPAGGGEIKQMTFHAASDEMEGWTWDSSEILFRSNRYNSASVYTIPVTGGNPIRMFDHYFNVVHNVAIHPLSGEIFFNDTWESFMMAHRKRYVGEYDPDIQSYNPSTGEFKKFTTWEGKDMWTTISRSGEVFFVSDEHTGQYNLFKLEDNMPKALTKFKSSIYHPQVSANGDFVAFEKDYQLYIYKTVSKKTVKLDIHISRNTLLPSEQSFKVAGKIRTFDVSPDLKKIAFVSRGALFVSDIKGKFIQELHPALIFERIHEVNWLADNQTLLFSMTWNGYTNWFTMKASGEEKAVQLTKDLRNNRSMVINKDQTQGAYLSGRDALRIMDLKSFETIHTFTDEFWGFQSGALDFSPDGKWLAYNAKRDFEDDVFVVNLENQKVTNLTQTGVSESGVKWGPEGKYLYLVTNRLKPSFPTGAGNVNLYRVALAKYEKDFKLLEFNKLFDTDTSKTKKSKKLEINIDTDHIWERFERISPAFGSQGSAEIVSKGSKTTLIYASNHDKGKWGLWKTELEPFVPSKTEALVGITGRVGVLVKGEKVFGLSSGSIYEINLQTKKATKINIDLPFTRNMQEEFNQMFAQTWADIEENFYHDNLHGEDWSAHKKYYQQFVPFLNNRDDFRRLMNEMLGELNSSHMGFNTRGGEEKSMLNYTTLECGLLFKENEPYIVDRVVKRGPADHQGIDIRPGDKLTSINGKKLDPNALRDSYFYRPAMETEMILSFKRDGESFDVNIHPTSSRALSGYFYNEWIDQNHDKVKELSDGQIAYAHMKNMGGGELNNFIMTMTRELKGKKGLILDLRYNTGGNVHDDVLRFLQQKTYLQWKSRGGALANQSNFAPSDYPIVLLINEQSLSDAEMTSAGFKALGLGTVMGTETYRWIIFTSAMGLVDGSSHRLPGWGCYTLEGVNLEKSGVQPDIRVEQSFTDRLQGKDPQLEKAIQHILSKN